MDDDTNEAISEATSEVDNTESGSIDIDAMSKALADNMFPGRDKAADEPEEEAETLEAKEPEAEAEVEAKDEPSEAPKSWPKEMREHWAKVPPEVQAYWNTREQQMLEGLSASKEDAAFARKLQEIANPYQPILNAAGVTLPEAVGQLLNAQYVLTTGQPAEKAALLAGLAKTYGVDLAETVPEGYQEVADPAVAELNRKVAELQSRLEQNDTITYQRALGEAEAKLAAFASDPKYPLFDAVADDMIPLIKAGVSLEEAYDRAAWANPVTRQKRIDALATEREEKRKAESIAKAKAAKTATSANIRGHVPRDLPTGGNGKVSNLREVIEETARELMAQ